MNKAAHEVNVLQVVKIVRLQRLDLAWRKLEALLNIRNTEAEILACFAQHSAHAKRLRLTAVAIRFRVTVRHTVHH